MFLIFFLIFLGIFVVRFGFSIWELLLFVYNCGNLERKWMIRESEGCKVSILLVKNFGVIENNLDKNQIWGFCCWDFNVVGRSVTRSD